VSSATTAADIARAGSQLHADVALTHRHQLQGLQSALADLTAASYRQSPVRDAAVLDEAVRHAAEVAGQLQRERNAWSLLRQGFGGRGTSWSRR